MKRKTKQRLVRGTLYSVLLGLVLAVALFADWTTIRANFWSPDGIASDGNWGDLIKTGARNTVIFTAIAFTGGLVLGLALALIRLSPVAPYRWLATAYIELFRGLPALIVILFMAFGLPIAFQWTPPGGTMGAGLVGLVLVAGAYMAETIRAGVQAVPPGQAEAARSLGMSPLSTMTRVVLPQAFRVVIPPLTNEFVLLIKDTALLFVIGAQIGERELTTVARDFLTSGPSAGTSTSLVQAALLYLAITLPLTQVVSWLERRQRKAIR